MLDFYEMAYLGIEKFSYIKPSYILDVVKKNNFTMTELVNYLGKDSESSIWQMIDEGYLKVGIDFKITV